MTWGLIARAERNRGLGVLTHLMNQYLKPDATMVITYDHEYDQHPEDYPDALVQSADDVSEFATKMWLSKLDVVVSCETFYDWRIVEWAKEISVKTVLYVMPELFKKEIGVSLPSPDEFWYPTEWMIERLPPGKLLPIPCEKREFNPYPSLSVQMIHIAGKKALGDRNGTELLNIALKQLRGLVNMRTWAQAEHSMQPETIKHEVLPGPKSNWDMYSGAHVLVMPRRFGGLCLPVIEALSQGIAIAMPAIYPNNMWPVVPIEVNEGRRLHMPIGPVETFDADPGSLRNALAVLNNPEAVTIQMGRSRVWAMENQWDEKKEDFLNALY